MPTPLFMILTTNVPPCCTALCRQRGITPLGVQPVEFATDVTLLHGNNCIKVGDLGARASESSKATRAGEIQAGLELEAADSLMVGINGRVAGLIHFRRSARLEAASTLQRLRSKRNVQIGIISNQSHPTLAAVGVHRSERTSISAT